MSARLIIGQTYVITGVSSWCHTGQRVELVKLHGSVNDWSMVRAYDLDVPFPMKSPACVSNGFPDCVYVPTRDLVWYDEKSAMREITPVREAEESVSEWRLPAGTFFRVNGKHTPLYLVMSNSHVFNLTEKQMHTTCSSRFKDVQLSVANIQLSEVL